MEVYDTQSDRIGEGVRQPDGSIDFRDPQENRMGRTGTPSTEGSVNFENAWSIRPGTFLHGAEGSVIARAGVSPKFSQHHGVGPQGCPVLF
jgi:hypothetical protein